MKFLSTFQFMNKHFDFNARFIKLPPVIPQMTTAATISPLDMPRYSVEYDTDLIAAAHSLLNLQYHYNQKPLPTTTSSSVLFHDEPTRSNRQCTEGSPSIKVDSCASFFSMDSTTTGSLSSNSDSSSYIAATEEASQSYDNDDSDDDADDADGHKEEQGIENDDDIWEDFSEDSDDSSHQSAKDQMQTDEQENQNDGFRRTRPRHPVISPSHLRGAEVSVSGGAISKPRWTDEERHSLLIAIIEEKQLDVFDTFDWDRVSRMVKNQSSESCHGYWRDTMLPSMASLYRTPSPSMQ